MFDILSREMLSPNICRQKVVAPRIAASAQPGQFLMVLPDKKGERVPLTISDYDREAGTVTIVTQMIGASTKDIVSFLPGESFADVVGPLGHASEFVGKEVEGKRYVFLAGGLGTAPIYPQARYLKEHGAKVDVIIGARTKELLIYTEEFSALCDNVYLCTDDGSVGFHGVVTGKLEKLVKDGAVYDMAVSIGPLVMMKFSTLSCVKLGIPVTVSMNTMMIDGTGMCGACRVSVDGKMKFACVDGPEFDGAKVDFDEAISRQGQYKAEEAAALENHKCHCDDNK